MKIKQDKLLSLLICDKRRWNEYRDSNNAPLDFSGVRLEHLELRRRDLRGASFENATLINIDLRGADLRNVNFRGAQITNTDFRKADVRGAVFNRDSWVFGSDFSFALATRALRQQIEAFRSNEVFSSCLRVEKEGGSHYEN